ncbi:MAG: GGDEF domain-containing protein [Acholeplasma sp.]|jgi:diguanylate cyclase (GGDEF)-like protein|nr:GGDEF domain-containing protein [Acholeplasma sp.]
MLNKQFYKTTKKLMDTYQLDVMADILLARDDMVIFYTDRHNAEEILLEVISGNLNTIGFEDAPQIRLQTIFDAFDYNNKYGEINGKSEYYHHIYDQVHDFSSPKDISFPIIHKGVRKWLRFNIYPSKKHDSISIFSITDVTLLHTQEEETFGKTHIDSLTKLLNKYAFDHHYGKYYLLPGFHVMYMDLDDFKDVNDRHGHIVGNLCLRAVADLLKSYENDMIRFYRLGGDEFIGLLVASDDDIKILANNIIEGVKHIRINDIDRTLTLSMGVMKANQSDDLARKADRLMYEVKRMGKNRFLYDVETV